MNKKHVLQDDLQILKDAILSSPKNPDIVYLSLNSLTNKINDVRILIQDISLDYFVLSETNVSQQHSFTFLGTK